MAQKRDVGSGKRKFFQVNDKAVSLKVGEQLLKVKEMLLMGGTGDDNIIQIPEAEVEASKDPVHHTLECIPCISQTEGHPQVLEEPERRGDRRLRYVRGVDRYLVISLSEVDLTENRTTRHFHREIHNIGQGVGIRGSHQVEAAEVSARPPTAVFFFTMWRGAPTDCWSGE